MRFCTQFKCNIDTSFHKNSWGMILCRWIKEMKVYGRPFSRTLEPLSSPTLCERKYRQHFMYAKCSTGYLIYSSFIAHNPQGVQSLCVFVGDLDSWKWVESLTKRYPNQTLDLNRGITPPSSIHSQDSKKRAYSTETRPLDLLIVTSRRVC